MNLNNIQELEENEMHSLNGGIWQYIVGYVVSEVLNGLQQDCSEVTC